MSYSFLLLTTERLLFLVCVLRGILFPSLIQITLNSVADFCQPNLNQIHSGILSVEISPDLLQYCFSFWLRFSCYILGFPPQTMLYYQWIHCICSFFFFWAMLNFHLLYIYPYLHKAWGNILTLWHTEKLSFREKKKKTRRKKLQKTSPYFLQKVNAYIKNSSLITVSSIDLSKVARCFSLLIYSLKLHFLLSNIM